MKSTERTQINLRISRRTARLLRAYAALRDMSPGALIDEMAEAQGIAKLVEGATHEKSESRVPAVTG